MDSGYHTSDSDDDFCPEQFRVVRRRPCRPETDQRGPAADAVYLPTPTMAALSPEPDHPSRPLSEDAQSQPRPGTDEQGAHPVDAPMAVERRSPDPPPRSESESGALRRRQPTRCQALTLRLPPYTVESVFDKYSKRRGALIRALTEGSRDEHQPPTSVHMSFSIIFF
jgi:hypothetical protein